MQGANGFDISRFTEEEVDDLITGLSVGDRFKWREEILEVTRVEPFECHCLWDLDT